MNREILNLTYPDKSGIKYKISKFPDGQQNIDIANYRFNSIEGLENLSIEIRSRLNNWLDLELICCAVASLRELNVKEIHLYTPYIVGARSDRKFKEGGNNYLKDVICPVLNSLNLDSITCIDPHSDCLEMGLKNFKKYSNVDLVRWTLMNEPLNTKSLEDLILVSPDAGASKKIYKIAEKIGYKEDIIICSKDRDKDGKLSKIRINFPDIINGEIDDKDLIIIDDICDGGATFVNIAKAFKEEGYRNKIYLIVTHGIFSKGFEELSRYFDGIFTTNSYGQLYANIESGYKGLIDMWGGPSEDQYYPKIPKNFVKQLDIF